MKSLVKKIIFTTIPLLATMITFGRYIAGVGKIHNATETLRDGAVLWISGNAIPRVSVTIPLTAG
jgi:hypothetical protein